MSDLGAFDERRILLQVRVRIPKIIYCYEKISFTIGLTPFLGPLGMQVSPAKRVDAIEYSSCDKLLLASAEGRATVETDPSAARPLQAGQA